MTAVAALGLGLLIGAVLGSLGGGGAILTVPLLVYALGQKAQDATTSSLVIVGLTAAVGMVGHARVHHVRWRTGIFFGLAGIVSAYAGTELNRRIDPRVLLLGFAAVMVAAAIGMLARAGRAPQDTPSADVATPCSPPEIDASADPTTTPVLSLRAPSGRAGSQTSATRPAPAPAQAQPATGPNRELPEVLGAGLAVGFLTGLFGVGGGFVIVPALTLVLGLEMPVAVGTSLLIIALNSASSLAARAGRAHFDWAVIVPFTLTAMAGTVLGRRIADRLPNASLNRAFAILLLLVAAYIGGRNAFALA